MGKYSRLKKGARMSLGKAGKKPVSLKTCPWDTGPDTAAQRAGKVVEDATYTDPDTGEKRNPNGVKRARRIDVAESLHRQGFVSARGLKAAQAIREAFERTQRTPPAIKKVQVDVSPKPDHAVAIQVDRLSKYHEVVKAIPRGYWSLVTWVAVDNRHPGSYPAIKKLAHMTPGSRHRLACRTIARMLDVVADAMGY